MTLDELKRKIFKDTSEIRKTIRKQEEEKQKKKEELNAELSDKLYYRDN